MPIRVNVAEVCDATTADSSNVAGYPIKPTKNALKTGPGTPAEMILSSTDLSLNMPVKAQKPPIFQRFLKILEKKLNRLIIN